MGKKESEVVQQPPPVAYFAQSERITIVEVVSPVSGNPFDPKHNPPKEILFMFSNGKIKESGDKSCTPFQSSALALQAAAQRRGVEGHPCRPGYVVVQGKSYHHHHHHHHLLLFLPFATPFTTEINSFTCAVKITAKVTVTFPLSIKLYFCVCSFLFVLVYAKL